MQDGDGWDGDRDMEGGVAPIWTNSEGGSGS